MKQTTDDQKLTDDIAFYLIVGSPRVLTVVFLAFLQSNRLLTNAKSMEKRRSKNYVAKHTTASFIMDATWCHFDLTLIIWLYRYCQTSLQRRLNIVPSIRIQNAFTEASYAEKLLKRDHEDVESLQNRIKQIIMKSILIKFTQRHTVRMATQRRSLVGVRHTFWKNKHVESK